MKHWEGDLQTGFFDGKVLKRGLVFSVHLDAETMCCAPEIIVEKATVDEGSRRTAEAEGNIGETNLEGVEIVDFGVLGWDSGEDVVETAEDQGVVGEEKKS